MRKKVNPRRKPVSQADLVKAEERACHLAMAIFLTVLKDKFNFSNDDIVRAWNEWDSLSESIKKGYVSLKDLTDTLAEEYDINLVV